MDPIIFERRSGKSCCGALCQGRAEEGARGEVVAAISIVSGNFLPAVCLPRAIGTVKGDVHRPPI